jgi:hypothetical protein
VRDSFSYLLGSMFSALALSSATVFAQDWVPVLNSEARYFSWNGTRGYPPGFVTKSGSGWQFYTPTTVQLAGRTPNEFKIELIGRVGYVRAEQTTNGATGSVSTATDTVGAATLTYLGIPGIQPFISLSTNLPTGRAFLKGNESFARMDPDFVELATFGEGFNIGPTIGFNIPINETTMVSLGVGHTVRGDYKRDPIPGFFLTGPTNLDPGDVTTFNASIGWKWQPISLQLSGSYSREGTTLYNDSPGFRLGNRYLVSGSASYAWSETSTTSAVVSWSHTERNETITPPLVVTPTLEAFNSNSSVYKARLEHAFLAGPWSFGPLASYMQRDRNAYSPSALQFVPAKERWSVGGSLRYFIGTKAVLYATAERFRVEEDSRPVAAPGGSIPALSSDGWIALLGMTLRP